MDHTTPVVDRITEAARRLRERAAAATPPADPYPGGWAGHGYVDGGLIRSALYGGPAELGYRTGIVVEVAEDCDGGCIPMSADDTAYIETVHPGVGLAVANWLEDVVELQRIADLNRDEVSGLGRAIAVADEVLGVGAALALADESAQVTA